jgi:hypothetical protein
MGKKGQGKSKLFAQHISEFFSQLNNAQDREVEQDLASHIQLQESLKAFTLREIKDYIKKLNKKIHQFSTLLLPEC